MLYDVKVGDVVRVDTEVPAGWGHDYYTGIAEYTVKGIQEDGGYKRISFYESSSSPLYGEDIPFILEIINQQLEND